MATLAPPTAPAPPNGVPPNVPDDATSDDGGVEAPGAAPRRASDRGLRRRLRPVFFWLHLTAGSALGLVILTQALTGISIAYRRQVVDAVIAGQLAPVPAGATRLPLDTLVARAAAATTGRRVGGVTLRQDPRAPVVVQLDGRRTAYVDPYQGTVLPGAPRLEGFFRYMEGVHRWLAFTGQRGPLGEATTGTSVLAFLFLLLSGLYLWIPARWTRRAVRAVSVPNVQARGRARDFNWHHVAGLWASPIILVVTVTGTFMAWEWPARWLAQATGSPLPAAEGRPAGGGAGGGGERGGERAGQSERGQREGSQREGRREGRGTDGRRANGGSRDQTALGGRALGGPPGAVRAGRPLPTGPALAADSAARAAAAPRMLSLDTLAVRALAAAPGSWYSVQLRLPGGQGGGGRGRGGPDANAVTASVSSSANLRPDLRTSVVLDPMTGAVRSRQNFADQDVARRARSWMHPVHSGEGWGVFGETIAVLSALATAVLVWTGLALALRRLRRAVAPRGRRPLADVTSLTGD